MSSAEFTPSESFDSQTGPNLDAEKHSVFLSDYHSFREINDQILKGLVLPKQPTDTVNIYGCDKNISSLLFNKYLFLKNIGYGIYLSNDPERIDNANVYRGLLNVSVMPKDKDAITQINSRLHELSRNRTNPNLNLIELINGVNSGLNGMTLNSNNVNALVANRELGGFPEEKRLPMLQRGFLTSLLLDTLDFDHWELYDNDAYDMIPKTKIRYFKDAFLYEILKSQGLEPFNPEEMLGIVSSIMQEILANNPDIPKPLSKRI